MSDDVSVLKHIDEMVERWSDIIVPIYTEKEHSKNVAQLLGSAFLVNYKGAVFLVTALHVIRDHQNSLLVISIGGKAVPLNKMPFAISEKDDLAIAYLDHDWAKKNDVNKVYFLPIDDHKSGYNTLGAYFLIGFPGKKNELNPRVDKVTKNIQGTSFSTYVETPKSNSHIDNPIAFEFDKGKVILTSGNKINPPSFSGNSGGPIMELIGKSGKSGRAGDIIAGCKLAGVFVGWYKKEKEAIAIRPEVITWLINDNFT